MTPQRVIALTYLRNCIAEGIPISITDMVRVGAGSDRWSAKRILRWAANEIQRQPPPTPAATADEPDIVSLREAAAAGELGLDAIKELIRIGEIRAVQIGERCFVDRGNFQSSCWIKHPLPAHTPKRHRDSGLLSRADLEHFASDL